MTIRSRLLILLLPTLAAFILLISFFFYINWSREILEGFQWRLQSIVVATAQSFDSKEIEWIEKHLNDPHLEKDATYLNYKKPLIELKQKLPVTHLYVVRIEPNVKQIGYHQVFLIDANDPSLEKGNSPGETDFSQPEEHQVYFTKKPLVTPIYESVKTQKRFISAYAPIFNQQGQVMALLGADVSTEEIDLKLNRALLIILFATLLPFIIIIITVFLIANRISQPVQQLNQAALDIASGNYETNIQVQGPKEIVELANTFNTMSECLVDHMHRLKETSITRKQLYGEQECAQLLQNYMLQKEIDEFTHSHWKACLASTPFSSASNGLLLKTTLIDSESYEVTLLESNDSGFSSLFQLNRAYSLSPSQLNNYNHCHCSFGGDGTVHYSCQKMPFPLGWCLKNEQWKADSSGIMSLESQDMLLLYNSALLNHFETEEGVRIWLGRVLRHFAKDGLDYIQTILNNELNYLKRRENAKENMAILIFMKVS